MHQLGDLGPRTASAVRDLAKALDRAEFDVEIDWEQPSRPTLRVTVTAATARHMAAVVEYASLDEQPAVITGRYLMTVSAVSSWLIEQDDGDHITSNWAALTPQTTIGLSIGERICVQAIMKPKPHPAVTSKPLTQHELSKESTRRADDSANT
ncbi:hypothetical protein [Mycobacteroides abscessus]|uniref:hypothetical protein n=1 Tax=Mycobacteroides abscessus TaxID=36809 RepID=UPI001057006C|nr:hypothetical protein [Mycobacteroides abscessus]